MNDTLDILQRYQDDYERRQSTFINGPSTYISELREAALVNFLEQGIPNRQCEHWKYTNVADLLSLPTQSNVARPQLAAFDTSRLPTGLVMVFIDGQFVKALSTLDNLPSGAIITTLQTAFTEQTAIIEAHLNKIIHWKDRPFAALNTAFMQDGVFLYLNDIQLTEPLHIVSIATGNEIPKAIYPRHLFVLDQQSKATLIEKQLSVGEGLSFTNTLTEVVLDRASTLNYYKIADQHPEAYHIAGLHVQQQADTQFNTFSCAFSSALTRNDLYIDLAAPGAQCNLTGLYLAGENQHIDTYTHVNHQQPNTTSTENYKGLVQSKGHAVFNGKIVVQPQAQHTVANLVNKNLLLASDAEIDTKPELQIHADDVRCTHGATVGQLDEQALFYLQSRGIARDHAERLLTQAFAQEILDLMKIDSVKTLLTHRLKECLS